MPNPLVIDISADYPDVLDAGKTPAIARLIDGSAEHFEHRVFSLNRKGSLTAALLGAGAVEPVGDDGRIATWRYRAPPFGLALHRSMRAIADAIVQDDEVVRQAPALVHGHKLSFEGIAAHRIARQLNLPYALTLQGNTDRKVIASRPDLRPLYRRIWRDAGAVFAMSPWIADYCARTLGERARSPVILPCITNASRIIPPRRDVPRLLITAFRLDQYENKNLRRLIEAVAGLRARHEGLRLEIAGSGSAQHEQAVDAMIAAARAADIVRRIGRVEPHAIQGWMNGAAAFVMPSHRESFGMVHIEALLSGCPILHSQGTGIDGYFPGAPFAIGCHAGDSADIARGIDRLLEDRAKAADALMDWQHSQGASFLAPAILAQYRGELERLVEGAMVRN